MLKSNLITFHSKQNRFWKKRSPEKNNENCRKEIVIENRSKPELVVWNASQTKLEEIGSLTHRNPRRSHGNTIKQILGLKLNKSWGWNHRKSKNGTGTKIELEQKKSWGWNKRNPSFESKEMLGVQPETHLAWNASSFPKSANTAESDCHREPNISILG